MQAKPLSIIINNPPVLLRGLVAISTDIAGNRTMKELDNVKVSQDIQMTRIF